MTDETRLAIVGMVGGAVFGRGAEADIATADVIVGARRHLDAVDGAADAVTIELTGALEDAIDIIDHHAGRGEQVCVLASGDPGFFGIVRLLGRRFGPERLRVHPAPSSVSLAFARVGRSWDDAVVVSAHGRPLADAIAAARGATTMAILTSPESPPEQVGEALRKEGRSNLYGAVVSRIGEVDEATTLVDLDGLADGRFEPLSVVVLWSDNTPTRPTLRWGRPDGAFAHRDGMITKAETRSVAIGKLSVPAAGVLWDVGAGSGSVSVECAALAPGLDVFAIERDPDQLARIAENAATHDVTITTVAGEAPAVLADLPDPDRVFVGGGGLAILDVALARLRPGGRVVATYAVLERAVAALPRLGHLVQVDVARAVPVGAVGHRLVPQNPVFVAWGPGDD